MTRVDLRGGPHDGCRIPSSSFEPMAPTGVERFWSCAIVSHSWLLLPACAPRYAHVYALGESGQIARYIGAMPIKENGDG